MFKHYADERHEKQAEEFITSLGKFVIAFERVCEQMRIDIICIFMREGLKNQGLAHVIVGDKTISDLQEILGALYNELRDQDDEDRKMFKGLLKNISKLAHQRNILLHSSWNFGSEAAQSELYPTTVRFRSKQNKGADLEVHGYSASGVNHLIDEATNIQVYLQRLQNCLMKKGLKVEKEFKKST